MKIMKVEWRDSNMYLTQCSQDEHFEIATITSVGFVLAEDKEKFVLAGDIIEDDARRVIVIPRENVIAHTIVR